jgi:hypothetical protein
MSTQEIINALLAAEPSALREVFSALHSGFAQKAEAIYDANPQENGLLAQPYADLSDAMATASVAFEEPAVDVGSERVESAPLTVTQAIEARSRNPWGGR